MPVQCCSKCHRFTASFPQNSSENTLYQPFTFLPLSPRSWTFQRGSASSNLAIQMMSLVNCRLMKFSIRENSGPEKIHSDLPGPCFFQMIRARGCAAQPPSDSLLHAAGLLPYPLSPAPQTGVSPTLPRPTGPAAQRLDRRAGQSAPLA